MSNVMEKSTRLWRKDCVKYKVKSPPMTTFKKSLYFGRHKIHHYSHFCSKCSIKEGNNHGDRKSSKNRSSAEKLLY